MTGWDPAKYLEFAGHRLRPALDLLARIPLTTPGVVYDLGCGAGNVTRLLSERWPGARVIGVDSSPAMLALATGAAPGAAFVEGELGAWEPEAPADLIFSNAALQWLDDHGGLLPRLAGGLAPGGILAVQMPRNHQAPSHTEMIAAAAEGSWRDRLAPLLRPSPVAPPASYYDLLAPAVRRVDIWETEYLQLLEGDDPVVEWVRGSALKPLLDALHGAEREGFLRAYRARIARVYPPRPDGRTLYPFRRVFIIAER